MKSTASAFLVALALFSAPLSQPALAVSETGFTQAMNELVWPAFQTGVDGSFKGVNGIPIRYRVWENPQERGAVVLLPGRADPLETFAETIYDLLQKGYSVYAMDHRGQGSSGRILPNPQLGYVDHFEDYVTDVKTFVDTVVKAKPHARRFLLAHSMGGAVSALYCHAYPQDFQAVALVAPMLRINTGSIEYWQARIIAWWNVAFGFGETYAPTQHDFDVNRQFAGNDLSLSQVRWQNHQALLVDHPSIRLGGATSRWVFEGLRASDMILHDAAPEFETPLLLLTAGKDTIAEIPPQQYFCERAPSCRAQVVYPDALHHILLERDSIREDAMRQIFDFFAEY